MKSNTSPGNIPLSYSKTILFVFFLCCLIFCSFSCQKSLLAALSRADSTSQQGITSEYNYAVCFSYRDSAAAGYIGQVYTDSALFDLKIVLKPDSAVSFQTRATASISNIRNFRPAVIPLSEIYREPDGETLTWTWIPDTVGLYNIDSVSIDNPLIGDDLLVDLIFFNDYGISPGYYGSESPSGLPVSVPALPIPPGPAVSPGGSFKVSNEVQSLGDSTKGPYFKITPIPH